MVRNVGCSELIEVLRPHLNWPRARLRSLVALVLALFRVRRVNLAQVAPWLNPWVQIASNYRRCQRFLAEFSFDQETIGRLILQLLPQDTLCLCPLAPSLSTPSLPFASWGSMRHSGQV